MRSAGLEVTSGNLTGDLPGIPFAYCSSRSAPERGAGLNIPPVPRPERCPEAEPRQEGGTRKPEGTRAGMVGTREQEGGNQEQEPGRRNQGCGSRAGGLPVL